MNLLRLFCVWLLAVGALLASDSSKFTPGATFVRDDAPPNPTMLSGGAEVGANPDSRVATGTLTARAMQDRLWSNGTSTTMLRFEAKLADGRSAAGMRLSLVAEKPFVGDVVANELMSDTNGVAVVEYRAGTRPGANSITATGAEGLSAMVLLRHGGLETEVRTTGLRLCAGACAPVVVAVRLLDLNGRPVAKAEIEAQVDERGVPGRGVLSRNDRRDELGAGWQVWSYTLPPIDPAEGWKSGRVELKFSAKPPGGGAMMESLLVFTLHGSSAFRPATRPPGITASVACFSR